MADDQWISVIDYLQSKAGLNHNNFRTIRDQYQQECDGLFPSIQNESALKKAAQRLKINTDSNFDILCECMEPNTKTALLMVQNALSSIVPSQNEVTLKKSNNSFAHAISNGTVTHDSSPSNIDDNVVLLTDINCVVSIKKPSKKVSSFIRSFLLQPISRLDPSLDTTTELTSNSITEDQPFVLDVQCPLYLFIREQMSKYPLIVSVAHSKSSRFHLVEPVILNDDFDHWEYDHLRGLFDFELEPHDKNTQFPARWHLADNISIYCCIKTINSNEKQSSSSRFDKLQTDSLDAFVRDVCARENKDKSDDWLKALKSADILHFEDLTSLDRTEWERIPGLTVNAKRILRTATDRHRTTASGEQRQQITNNPNDKHEEQIESLTPAENSSTSDSEIYANLHLIKLYVWHTLRYRPAVKQFGDLAKLEIKCLGAAFEEMRAEGFAEDGLFSKMKEFFLPLSISHQELHSHWSLNGDVQRKWLARRDALIANLEQLNTMLEKESKTYLKCSIEFNEVEKSIDEEERNHSNIKAVWNSKKNNTKPTGGMNRLFSSIRKLNKQSKEEIEAVRRLYEESEERKSVLLQKLNKLQENKDDIKTKKKNIEIQIEEKKSRLNMIETKLNTPQQPVDNQLVKPPRGLILYGPPGTGKSDILSKLAKKVGIVFVCPPLAAGELNRPLVGESERILIALCSRCYHIPYAMCCISIDEIDSLAPKRDEDSSEGKVDKISVLLSLIEGIKDVPNLMILSATNRLHMMDEAFLRRMSGKFFVGRPSSEARISMLRRIPFWALEPELIDQLSIATTNFSGAAVKALTRAITVKCIKMKLSEPIAETEALKLADLIAQQYQIFIGSETLPRLLLRNRSIESNHHIHQLLGNFKYTGRMIVDLQNQRIRIEVLEQKANTKQSQLSIIERELYPNETNVQTLLERLAAYGKSRNVQLLQLIDLNLLASQGAYDEKKVYETLKDRYDECISYTKSMIVYDLDALVGINKSESNSNMGLSISYSVNNQSIYSYVLARFRDRVMEDTQEEEADKIERWAIAVIREPFLLRQFSEEAQFPRTHQEEEELQLERRKAEDILKCVKCKDFYIENENRMGSCTHHDGFVYDNSLTELIAYAPSDVVKSLNRLERRAMNDADRRDELERQKTKFKWICCDETFTTGSRGGCKRGKHGYFPNNNESLGKQVVNRRTNQRKQATIQQWEDDCCANDEYHQKWALLNDS